MAGEGDGAKGAGDGQGSGQQGAGSGGAGSGSGEGKTFTQAELDAMVGGLKGKNTELLGTVRELKDRMKAFDGMDPQQVREAMETVAKLNEEKQRSAGKFDELKQQLQETHKKELSEREKKIERVVAKLYEHVGRNKALEAVGKLEGNAVLLMPHIERHLRVVEDGDDYVPRIVDEKGRERIGPKGAPMTVEEFVQELSTKEALAPAFKAPAASGSGRPPGDGRPPQRSGANVRLTREQAQDVATYRRAREEAEKLGGIVEVVG